MKAKVTPVTQSCEIFDRYWVTKGANGNNKYEIKLVIPNKLLRILVDNIADKSMKYLNEGMATLTIRTMFKNKATFSLGHTKRRAVDAKEIPNATIFEIWLEMSNFRTE